MYLPRSVPGVISSPTGGWWPTISKLNSLSQRAHTHETHGRALTLFNYLPHPHHALECRDPPSLPPSPQTCKGPRARTNHPTQHAPGCYHHDPRVRSSDRPSAFTRFHYQLCSHAALPLRREGNIAPLRRSCAAMCIVPRGLGRARQGSSGGRRR